MSNELVPTVPTGLTFLDEGALVPVSPDAGLVAGMSGEDLREGDIASLPRMRLVQKEKDGLTPGWWHITSTGECVEHPVIFVLAEVGKGQIMWPEKYSPDNMPMCYSNDGFVPAIPTPARPMTDPQPGPCFSAGPPETKCSYACFTDDPNTGERVSPRCKYQRKFYVAVVLDGAVEVVQCQFHGKALGPVKQLSSRLVRPGGLYQSYVLDAKRSDDGYDYWIPVFAPFRKADPASMAVLDSLRDEYYGGYKRGEIGAQTTLDYEDYIDGETVVPETAVGSEPMVEEDEIPF